MGQKSAVAKARQDSPSLRTTIPEEIAGKDGLAVKAGDILDWEITTEKGRTVARVKKLE